ncbi:MFS general substrate transporter [Coemansia reversa NRRL 1564]|uniref:MFS general substrate transporter n=1 Tax=Coemansia reversa (strain ATCC 12441 / NRRL 1564) TaxID=763665 RepID=A0A2G5BGU5_COERN|nr:MFS general substrate transporter [Coemansia reversa NRRL 1564]|eukprot:PIA18223.1 MFS general substrate transporter [Coemansia reversa NRRL 1564]
MLPSNDTTSNVDDFQNSVTCKATAGENIGSTASNLDKFRVYSITTPGNDKTVGSSAKPQPAGSFYAWVIVACAALNLMCTLGVSNSFGVFSTYYINFIYSDVSAANISWIGTMLSVFMLGGSIFSGPLTDRFGFRLVSLAGTVICSAALLLASFTQTLWQLIFTQGIMFGVGAACIFAPSVTLPAQWHKKTRPLATGVAVAGSGIGGIVFTELTQIMMERIGYRWTLRTLALIMFCISSAAGMFYKRRVAVPQGGTSFMTIASDIRLAVVGMAGLFVNISYFVPWYYLPTAAIQLGQTRQAANNLILYMNIGSTLGRVFAVYMAIFIGAINSIVISYIICAILVLVVMLAVRHMVGYIILSIIYGGLSASFISITPLVLTNIFGTQSVTTAMGIMNLWCSIGVLVGNPSQGAIYQTFDRPNGSFNAISIWGFVGIFFAACSYFCLKCIIIRGSSRKIWTIA